MFGNNTIEDITNYADIVAVMEKLTTGKTFAEKSGQILDGTCPKTAAGIVIQKALALNGAKRQIKLVSGLCQSALLWPAQYTKGLIVELYVNSAAAAGGITDATEATLTISDVAFILETVEVSPVYKQSFEQALMTQGIKFHCPTFLTTTHTTSGTSYSTTLSENMKSVKTVYFWCRDTANNNNPAVNQSEIFQGKNMTSYQFRHGVKMYPNNKVDCSGTRSEAFAELLKAVNVASDVTIDIDFDLASYSDDVLFGANKLSTGAIFAQNFEVDADENQGGIDSNAQPLSITVEFGEAVATNLYTAISYDSLLIITPQGIQSSF